MAAHFHPMGSVFYPQEMVVDVEPQTGKKYIRWTNLTVNGDPAINFPGLYYFVVDKANVGDAMAQKLANGGPVSTDTNASLRVDLPQSAPPVVYAWLTTSNGSLVEAAQSRHAGRPMTVMQEA